MSEVPGYAAAVGASARRAGAEPTGTEARDIEPTGAGAAGAEPSDAEKRGIRSERAPGWRLAICIPPAAAVTALSLVPAAQFAGWQWLSLLLAGPVAIWGGWPVHRAAWRGLGRGPATMDTLASLSISAALGWSLVALFFGSAGATGVRTSLTLAFGPVGGATIYLDVASALTVAILAGQYLEARAPSRPDAVLAACAGPGEHAVWPAAQPLTVQPLTDQVTAIFVPCVLSLAAATLGFWLGAGVPAATACSAAVAVLVVACPYAAGLATPTALLTAVSRGAELGILVQSGRALEAAAQVRIVILDQAGTLTTGEGAIRAGGTEAVAAISRLGLSAVILTGDSPASARAMSARLGVPPERIFGGVGPEDTVQVIRELQAGGVAVAMAGDALADAAALAQADLALVLGNKTAPQNGPATAAGPDAAGADGLILVSGDPRAIADALQLARAAMAVSRANLGWAFAYSVVAIPAAALGFRSPLAAIIAVLASCLIVVGNSLRLRRFRPGRR